MDLDQEKRVMLAFALSIVMLVLYRVYFVKEPPPEPKKAAATAAATTAPGAPEAPKTASPGVPAPPPAKTALPVLQGATPQDIVVENKFYRVTLSTQGAVVKSWVLKGYPVGEQVEIVNGPACDSLGYPMSLNMADSTLKTQVNQGIYIAKATEGSPSAGGNEIEISSGKALSPPVTLAFTYSNGNVQARKQFSFREDYVTKVEVSVFDGQYYKPVEVAWPGGFGDQMLAPPTSGGALASDPALYESIRQGVYGSIGDLTTVVQGKVKQARTIPGPLQLAGLEDKYFAAIFLPDAPDQVSFNLARQDWAPPDWTKKDKPNPLAASLADTQPKPLAFRLFVGPKAFDVLKSVNPPLDSLINFGWFSVIAKPLFICMRYINDHWVHNYGWAIVILTLVLTSAMFPLKLKSLRSAQEMQKVQPIVKGIQDKYKNYKFNDPRKQKMNEEVMKVYSEHGINPLGGCLPMVLQLPVLYAFYAVLGVAIELRHAPWIWWVTDLSSPDRLNVMGVGIPVLVILMTLASFFSMKMTPQPTTDPSQARMMMMMPLFMGFMFYRFASGMVLYWFTSSVVQIVQQIFINRRMPPSIPLPVSRKTAEAKG